MRLEPSDVLLERVDEHPERQVSLELRRRAGEDEVPGRLGLAGELAEQARLADPWLADEHDRRRAALVELGQKITERAELGGASDEMLGNSHICDTHDRSAARNGLIGGSEASAVSGTSSQDQGAGSGCSPDVGEPVQRQARPMSSAAHENRDRPDGDPVPECRPAPATPEGAVMNSPHTTIDAALLPGGDWRELASRDNDGLEVSLLWSKSADQVRLVVADTRLEVDFELDVSGADALAAFYHPFSYLATPTENEALWQEQEAA